MKFLHRSKSQSSLLPSEISNLALVIKETKKSFCDSKRIAITSRVEVQRQLKKELLF